jgi:hypothetical protein
MLIACQHSSIFFVTTYFSDYILVPSRARHTVTKALQQRGFVFSKSADAFVSQLSPSSPTLTHTRQQSSGSSFEFGSSGGPSAGASTAPPITPPAQSVPELQTRTFSRLRKSNVVPAVDRSIRLMSCAGHKDSQSDGAVEAQLRDDLMQVLLATCPGVQSSSLKLQPPPGLGLNAIKSDHTSSSSSSSSSSSPPAPPVPDFSTRFLSLTLTDTEPISVLLEHKLLLERVGRSLLGSRGDEDVLVPITLDLRDLPLEASGIVCGVAGRLAQETKASGGPGADPSAGDPSGAEISFLSTARAGTVIVKESELERALRALEQGAEVEREG